jgi:hypothetical protein
LAGGLAVATVVACVTAIALNDRPVDDRSAAGRPQTLSDDETAGGLISFATPSGSGSPTPTGKQHTSASASPSASPSPSASSSPRPHSSSSPGVSAAPSAHGPGKPSGPPTSADERSVQAVNYPDRYWHVSGSLVKLDVPGGSESREDSTFHVVSGLSDNSCISFATRDGRYLRHRNFVLRADYNDGSSLYQQDATFCPGYSGERGAVLLYSANYPNYALRHKDFGLRLDPYGYNTTNRSDFSFRLVSPLG